MTLSREHGATERQAPRWWISGLYILAAGLGFMPYALGVASWRGALLSLAVISAVTLFMNRKPFTYAGPPPTGEELVLAFLGYMCGGAVCAFSGLTAYLVVKLLFDLITLVG